MKIKEVALNEIHWTIKQWNVEQQANDRLKQKLGDLSRYFAKCNVGAAFYSWNVDTNARWTPLPMAQPTEEMLARKRWEEIKQEVRAKMGAASELTERILEVPNEEYIFYSIDDNGQVQVLITGWGFKNFRKVVIGPEVVVKEAPGLHPVSIAFTIDGVKLPNRPFFIVTSHRNTPHNTDAQGVFSLGDKVEPNTTIELIDGPTERRFTLVTDQTTEEYTFDVTERITVRVMASHDNQPIDGEEASIDYHGRSYQLTLEAGQASVGLAYYEGELCVARFRDSMQQQTLTREGHIFRFDTNSPVEEPVVEEELPTEAPEPEPGPVTPHIRIEGLNGFIGSHYPITVEYDGKVTEYISDEGGIVLLPEMEAGKSMIVTDGYDGNNKENYLLDAAQEEYVFHVPYEPADNGHDIKVTVIDVMKRPVTNANINFRQGDTYILSSLDGMGTTWFGKDKFKVGVPVTAQITTPRRKFPPIVFTLDADETEYVLQEVKGPQPFTDILIEIVAALGAAGGLVCAFLLGGFIIDIATTFITGLLRTV